MNQAFHLRSRAGLLKLDKVKKILDLVIACDGSKDERNAFSSQKEKARHF